MLVLLSYSGNNRLEIIAEGHQTCGVRLTVRHRFESAACVKYRARMQMMNAADANK